MKKFILRFGVGILIFIGLNFFSLVINHGGCIDCYGDFGVPFTLAGSNFMLMNFIWTGLLADFIFAMICSFGIGFIWTKINSKKLL